MPVALSFLLASLGVLAPAFAMSQPLVQTGRYTAVAPVATPAQQEPLRAIVTAKFPETVTTIGAAVERVLSGTGYALHDVSGTNPDEVDLLSRPLPDVQRSLGPVTLLDALKVLAGPAFRVEIDRVHRLIGFELDPDAQGVGVGDLAAGQEAHPDRAVGVGSWPPVR